MESPKKVSNNVYELKYNEVLTKINYHCENEATYLAAKVLSDYLSELDYKYKLADQMVMPLPEIRRSYYYRPTQK